jgi:hypothetical protein
VERRRQTADDNEADLVRDQLAEDQPGLKPPAERQEGTICRRPSRISATWFSSRRRR